MKKGFLKCAIALFTLAIAFAASAQTGDDPNGANANGAGVGGTINQGIDNIGNSINSGFTNLGKTINTGLAKNQDLFGTALQNSTNSLITWLNGNLVTGTPPAFSQSMKGNWQLMTANFSLSNLNWLLTRSFTVALLSGVDIDSGDNTVPTTLMSAKDIYAQVGRFNVGSLLSTTTIAPNSDASRNAQSLLQFVAGLNNSVSALPKGIVNRGLGPVNDFQNQFGTYLAQQSVGLNALYNLLNKRYVKKGLGAQLGGPQQDMSPLGLDEYMATHRLSTADGNNSWYKGLANLTPAQTSKEELMLLAEMRYQAYLTQQTLEQIATLLAVQQLQTTAANAAKLQQLKENIMSASTSTILNN